MKLSTKGRYAVMALVDLAATSAGKPVSLADIAERQEISLSYLEQLFAKLRRGQLVSSVRGPGGGYLLARSPADIAVADVILAVDEPIRTTRCTPGQPIGCRQNQSRCMTHDLWEELGNQIYLYLSSVSLEDVVARRVGGGGALSTPSAVDTLAEPSRIVQPGGAEAGGTAAKTASGPVIAA